MYMPVPAIAQAMMAPNGPVAVANRPGRLKIPAPTIDPTTIPVKAKSESFSVALVAIAPLLGSSMHRTVQSGACAGWIRCGSDWMNLLIASVGTGFEEVKCL